VSLYLIDTDHLSLYQNGHPRLLWNLLSHSQDTFAISVVTVEETLTGWQTALRQARDDARRVAVYRRLAQTAEDFANWRVLPFPLTAMTLYRNLVRMRLNVGSYDLQIAAIACDAGAIILTRNLRDFRRVPGLQSEDWSV
jgi:tRNA(fMet)-specific endonuclease VapC